ncbi:PREDICTED: myb-related protein Myb4 [Nelumbo nucifera]|uniref:Uncharacterized protein n=2 Tax=Nelumbo nucifera TaxID=4432 RepID=A0A822ZDL9_NELNU|nr:PREDICTED: myb-related protein Myb4 [Nelumbo nucifera]DAD44294.1 TPA_asm: hypothetical protein HUJ06_002524 [Nelumbo nucifera]
MGRSPCCAKEGLNRGAWTALEDKILTDYIKVHGEGRWRNLPKKAGLKRCGKSCRLRWLNYLRPDIKRGNITRDEEDLIVRLHRLLGNRWSLIAGRLPGRTDNEIKNYWNTNLGKKVQAHTTTIFTGTKKKTTTTTSTKNIRAVESPPIPKLESRVVRTKAFRCSKVFLGPPQNKMEQHTDNDAMALASKVGNFSTQKALVSESYDGQSSFTPEKENGISLDFTVNLNPGELFLSELLNSDFSQLGDFDDGLVGEVSNDENNNNNDSSPSSDQPPFFPDELFEWKGSDCGQSDVISDLRSLASFLDCGENWLAE